MSETFDHAWCPDRPHRARLAPPDEAAAAADLREQLSRCLDRLAAGTLPVHVAPAGGITSRAEGHFHLAPELFLQVAGTTHFRFPAGGALTLDAGCAAVLPARLLHAEAVRPGGPDAPFRNLVVYAEGPRLSCHLAHEAEPGRPGILHLEARHDHPDAARIHGWLTDATRAASDSAADDAAADTTADRRWGAAQTRALVAAAIAGVLRALDDGRPEAAPAEPPLVARLRVLVNNQLGDPALSVRTLARQSGCTPDYLSNVFSRSTGEHLVACITRLRMERAARLLRDTTMAGKEVAWSCGYATPGYFVRVFRTHHGVTPMAFRARRVDDIGATAGSR